MPIARKISISPTQLQVAELSIVSTRDLRTTVIQETVFCVFSFLWHWHFSRVESTCRKGVGSDCIHSNLGAAGR